MDALSMPQYGFAPALASALMHSLWQGTLLAIAAGLTLAAMARTRAAARHLVAMLFLVAMLLAPTIQFLQLWHQPAAYVNAGLLPTLVAQWLDTSFGVFDQDSLPIARAATLLWLLGAGLMLARHIGGLRLIGAMQRRPSQSLPPALEQCVDALRAKMGVTRDVAVRLTLEVVSPCAARLLRPVIWLPLSLVARAPTEQIEALLAHELAHIARMDWLWNGMQCVVESLLFFHPAVWWLGRRIRRERELACDKLAVLACGDAIALAEGLAALERQQQASPRLALAASGGSLMQRISHLLSAPPSGKRSMMRAGFGILAFTGLMLAVQARIAGNALPELQVTSTTEGALGPGDVREITANEPDLLRHYRASVDAQGHLTEVYKEDGQIRPINGDTRAWIDALSKPLSRGATVKSLARLIVAGPRVTAALGTPAVFKFGMSGSQIICQDAACSNGEADFRGELKGPKGRSTVHVSASLESSAWTLVELDFG